MQCLYCGCEVFRGSCNYDVCNVPCGWGICSSCVYDVCSGSCCGCIAYFGVCEGATARSCCSYDVYGDGIAVPLFLVILPVVVQVRVVAVLCRVVFLVCVCV